MKEEQSADHTRAPHATKLTMDRFEFAARVGISRATVDRLLAAGDVSCVRIGTRVLFTEAHAVELLAKFEQKVISKGKRP